MAEINKKHLEHLAELSRIKLKIGEENKLLKDLENILDYFNDLKNLDTEEILPITGGGGLKNKFREDKIKEDRLKGEGAASQFPEKERGYLKVPPVFE